MSNISDVLNYTSAALNFTSAALNVSDAFNITQAIPALVPAPYILKHLPTSFANVTKLVNKTKSASAAASYPPLFTAQYLPATTLVCLLLTWICSSAGIGGAALDSVVFILIMGLVPKQVSPLTKALVFGESLGGFLINVRRHHPFLKRPLINYEVALAFEPFSLLGTTWGVYANQSFPSYIILAGLIIVLSFACYRTINKGILLLRSERKEKKEKEEKKATEGEAAKAEVVSPDGEKVYDCDWFLGKREGVEYFSWKISLFLIGNWVVLALFNVLVGSTAVGIACGTALYWGLMVLTIPALFVLAVGIAFWLHKRYQVRKETNYEYTVADLKWSWKRIIVYQAVSLCTGILAAMFGLGGGTLNSPALLELGLLPAQVPATSGLMILLTSSVAIIQYIALGKVKPDYLGWFIMVGFFGGISGHLGIRYYIKRYRKQSLIVFLLGFLVFAGLVVLIYTVSILFVTQTATMTIASPCSS